MTLYLIGIGLSDEKDITMKGIEAVKKCNEIYLESYTSKLNAPIIKLEKLYGKKIISANRDLIEKKFHNILEKAKNEDIALLIIGDVFSATTHIDIMLEAKKNKTKIVIINNASVLNTVGITGLSLYKFGNITSIPFNNKDIKSPIKVFKKNYKNDQHTLFLLDLDPKNNKYLTINQAVDYLLKNKINKSMLAVGCTALGSLKPEIKAGKLKDLKTHKFNKFPQCLIIPAKNLHFMEEEALNLYK